MASQESQKATDLETIPPEPSSFPLSSVFNLIHDLHSTITRSIDTSLNWEQLNSPPINYTLVRPIIDRLSPNPDDEKRRGKSKPSAGGLLGVPSAGDGGELGGAKGGQETCLGAVLFALMANRLQFITLADSDLSYAPLQTTRAAFCELLAIKVLRKFPRPEEEADLAGELVRGFCAFDGASEEVWEGMGDDRKEVSETKSSALELSIVSTSKHFLSLPLIQHLIHEIYVGHLVYSPTSSRALITDSYVSEGTRRKRLPSHSSLHRPAVTQSAEDAEDLADVYIYNPYEAGWLDHGRLRVPKWRKYLEFTSIMILLVLFVTNLSFKDLEHITAIEVIFIIFTAGFILEEFAASKEHGWTVYVANAWNAFDLSYIVVFLLYFVLRLIALISHSPPTSDLAFDILACGACILFPRLVFFLLKDNVVILALRAMISRFISFMLVVIVAFSGICFCLWTLGRGTWTVRQITWLMLQIWFGSSYLGFSASSSFHPIFGPIILIGYAALCNTLLITILISILSNEFADINANAQEEHLFQRVVKTVEGVKSDAVFSYLPPINLLAVITLTPLSWILSPRNLHRINVFGIRLTSFPILIAISAYERYQYRSRRQIHLKGPDHIQRSSLGLFDSFLGGGNELLISSVFEVGPPVSGQTTPPKASSVAGPPGSGSEDEDEEDGMEARQSGGTFDSPLAKIFGSRSASVPGHGALSRRQTSSKAKGGDRTVDTQVVERLKEEVKEVRESQLRMEEMLAKVLAGSSK